MNINDQAKYNDLIGKKKEELEKIKLALEVLNYEDNLNFEKKKYAENLMREKKKSRGEFLRLLLVLVVGAVITLAGNYVLELTKDKNSKLAADQAAIDAKVAEQIKYVNDLRNQLPGADLRKQINIHCLIGETQNPTNDAQLATVIKQNKQKCDNANISNIEGDMQAIKSDSIAQNMDENTLEEFEENEEIITNIRKDIADGARVDGQKEELTQALDKREKLINSDKDLKELVETTKTIEKRIESQIKEANLKTNEIFENQKIIKTYDTWFKEGYFRQLGDIRITLITLFKSDQMILVRIRNTSDQTDCTDKLDIEKRIKSNEPYKFKSCSREYMLSLKTIGKAGKNPFNLAAYITLIELE